MPLITATFAQLLASVVDVLYGIFVEKFYVSWTSVILNAVNFIIALAAITLPTEVFIVLAIYAFLGAIAASKAAKGLYVLFGAKTYGCLMLVLSLNEFGHLGWAQYVGNMVNGWFGTPSGEIVFGWIVLALIVHLMGAIVAHNSSTKAKAKPNIQKIIQQKRQQRTG
ncbi:MAG: hypothetical protein ABSD99_04120 [Candidatus Bathyarchaeia archaeon]|jgi:ribulose kinase